MKIPSIINSETNNFDFLRLLAAFLVFFGHTILITRHEGFFNWDRGVAISATGVNIFFIISGFLITKSWLSSDNFVLFAKKRLLRIYPGLIVAGIFTVLVIGPFSTFFPIHTYLNHASTATFFKNTLLLKLIDIKTSVLPGVFVSNKLPLIVNASLWTVPVEMACYFFIATFGLFKLFDKKRVLVFLLLFFLIYSTALFFNKEPSLSLENDSSFPYFDIVRLVTYFISGAVIYLYRKSISMPRKYFLFLSLILLTSVLTAYFGLISYFLLPIFIIILAMIRIDFPKKITRWGDFSYGFYLYAFPVQQAVSSFFGNELTLEKHLLISFFLTLSLAILSWNLIEKPFLKLKRVSIFKSIWH